MAPGLKVCGLKSQDIQHLQQAHQQSQQQQQQQPQQQQQTQAQQQLKPQEPQPLQQRRSSCTRNQFECKSSGECIAIYNACDGIPQCSDGSDEAVELHCPSDNSNFGYNSPPRIPSGGVDPNSGKINPMPVGSSGSGSVPALSAGQIASGGNTIPGRSQQEDYRFSLPSSQQSAASISAGGATQRLASGNGKMDVTFPLQPQSPQGGSQSMNIFNHKDGGIMDETYANQNQPQRHTPYWKQPNPLDYSTVDLPQQNNGGSFNPQSIQLPGPFTYGTVSNAGNYGNTYNLPGYGYQQLQPQGMPPGQQMQQNPLQFNQYGGSNNAHAGGYPPLQQPQQPFYQQTQYTPNMGPGDGMMYRPPNSVSGISPVGNPIPTSSTAIQANVNPVSVNVTASVGDKSAQSSGTSGTSSPGTQIGVSYHEISKLQLPENLRSLSAELQSFAAESENDVEMHAAGAGAILAFILGLMMSVVMALIVGCRLRRIGTRRRGKNRLDPDYLVDGMYL